LSHQKGSKSKRKLFVLVALFVIVLGSLLGLSFKAFHKYEMWHLHKSYFDQNISQQHVEAWMSLRLIEKRFDIDVAKVLGIDLTFYQKRHSLGETCIQYKRDCNAVIKKLNQK